LEKNFEIIGMEEIYKEKDKDVDQKKRELLGYAILLKPKNTQMAIKKISVEVKAEQFSLAGIEVEEASGNRNRIEFEKLELNRQISLDFFQFIPLPGTKIITPEDFPVL
jgi:outer membrane lipoprotein-sorting protein